MPNFVTYIKLYVCISFLVDWKTESEHEKQVVFLSYFFLLLLLYQSGETKYIAHTNGEQERWTVKKIATTNGEAMKKEITRASEEEEAKKCRSTYYTIQTHDYCAHDKRKANTQNIFARSKRFSVCVCERARQESVRAHTHTPYFSRRVYCIIFVYFYFSLILFSYYYLFVAYTMYKWYMYLCADYMNLSYIFRIFCFLALTALQ